jgi:hypothetical protein
MWKATATTYNPNRYESNNCPKATKHQHRRNHSILQQMIGT